MRDSLRHAFLSVMALGYRVTGVLEPALKKNRIQFLYSHEVNPENEESFRAWIQALLKHHRFISYSQAVERLRGGAIDAPYLVFSFDDALKNNLRAAKILNEFDISACFFVCPPLLEEANREAKKKFSVEQLHLPLQEFLTWRDAELLLKQGHEIGSHTLTHRNLAKLPEPEAQKEIRESFAQLKRKLGVARHFSWPYGRFEHFKKELFSIVFDAGYESCASAERGCHLHPFNLKELPILRDHVMFDWPIGHGLYFLAKNSRTKDRSSLWGEAQR